MLHIYVHMTYFLKVISQKLYYTYKNSQFVDSKDYACTHVTSGHT